MLPSAATYGRGVKDTSDVVSQEKPIEIGNKIWMHDPNKNKGLAWAMRTGEKVNTTEHIFGHLADVPFPNWVEHAGANEATQHATVVTLKATHGERVTLGSRIYWPRTDEIIRIDAVMNNDATTALTRNYGRGTAATALLRTGDKGLIITPGFQQGFTTGLGQFNAMTYQSFATEEVSWPVASTYVETAEKSRGGNPFRRALKKSWKAAKDQMEGTMYFGAKRVSTLSTVPITVSEGINNILSTNTYSATSISRMDLWDIIAEWVALNKDGGSLHCSMIFRAMVTMWAMDKVIYNQDTKKDGLDIQQLLTPFGTFDLVDVDLFGQEPTLAGTVFFVPSGRIHYRPLVHEKNLDLRYNPISRDEVHSDEGEIYGVYGWEFFEEEMWAKLSGLQFAA